MGLARYSLLSLLSSLFIFPFFPVLAFLVPDLFFLGIVDVGAVINLVVLTTVKTLYLLPSLSQHRFSYPLLDTRDPSVFSLDVHVGLAPSLTVLITHHKSLFDRLGCSVNSVHDPAVVNFLL